MFYPTGQSSYFIACSSLDAQTLIRFCEEHGGLPAASDDDDSLFAVRHVDDKWLDTFRAEFPGAVITRIRWLCKVE